MDFEISVDADGLHQAALNCILQRMDAPPGVRFPDGFRAGEGAWATTDKPIPKLVPFSEELEESSAVWRNEMSRAWMEGAMAILCDFRIPFGKTIFGSSGVRAASKESERLYPGILESSGVAYCVRQADEYSRSIDENRLDEELAGWEGHGMGDTIAFCESIGVSLTPTMYRLASLSRGFYAQKSLRKNFDTRDGRTILSSPWSWSDFEIYCEESFFGGVVSNGRSGPLDVASYDMSLIFGSVIEPKARVGNAVAIAGRSEMIDYWCSGVGIGQMYRCVWEMSDNSPDSINHYYMASWVGATAMYSISRGGNRSMDRKIQKYLNGEMSKNRRR